MEVLWRITYIRCHTYVYFVFSFTFIFKGRTCGSFICPMVTEP